MGRIQVLSDQVINRIAAGEVIERPASAVKELVENSLDAGAGSVEIRVEGGGSRRILVRDDGAGMDRDDALLAIERHATSKLRSAEDLGAIGTLGFRGEALASVAAVSRLVLRSSIVDGRGTEIEVRAGRIGAVRDIGLPRGTSIEVDSLFFNVPARRKFLRSEATEISHVLRWATRYALAWPSVRFVLEHGDRRLLDLPPAANLEARATRIFGGGAARRLVAFERERNGVRAWGLAGRPADATGRRDVQHVFVNGRVVQDRVLSHAIQGAYENSVARDRHPALVLFLEIDAALVDVNVHPQKLEVRFSRPAEIHDLVRDAIGGAFSDRRAVPALGDLRAAAPGAREPEVAAALRSHEERSRRGGVLFRPFPERRVGPPEQGDRFGVADPSSAGPPPSGLGSERAEVPVPIAQFRDAYILADDGEAIVVVDQHAAHERILFERFLKEAEEGRVEVQALVFPVMIELSPHEISLFEQEKAELGRLGFRAEAFGGGTVRLDAIPAVAAEVDPEKFFLEILGEAARCRSAATSVEGLRRKLVTTAACHAAVKAKDRLSPEEMKGLIERLYAASSPTTCPHGRPTLFRITMEEIERAFRRR